MSRSVLLVVMPQRPAELQVGEAAANCTRFFVAFPYGCLTIASYLKHHANGLETVEVLDLNLPSDETPEQVLEAKLWTREWDIIGFSMSYDSSYPWIRPLLDIVKYSAPSAIVVAGGPAVTTAYTEILAEYPEIDACCYSEGEIGLKTLVEADDVLLALEADPWVTRAKRSARTVYEDLDKVVDIDYGMVDIDAYGMKEAFSPFMRARKEEPKQFFLVTSRGCPFQCVFCAEPSYHGAGMRYVSVDKVVDHVTMLHEQYGLNVLTIYDDQILMNHARAKEIFRRLAPLDIRIEMPNGVTLSYIDEEMAHLMRAAGVDTLYLAIEHGSARVLKDVIKKPIAVKKIKPTIEILHKAGIYCQGFFVIGLPGETRAERQETRDAIIDWGLDWATFNFATPLRGTELYRVCKEKGWVDPKDIAFGSVTMTGYVIKAPGMDKAEIEDFVLNVNLDVNFVHNRNMRVGNYDVAKSAFAEVVNRHPGQPFAHYFLGECQSALGEDSSDSINRAMEIVERSEVWQRAFVRHGLVSPSTPIPFPTRRELIDSHAAL